MHTITAKSLGNSLAVLVACFGTAASRLCMHVTRHEHQKTVLLWVPKFATKTSCRQPCRLCIGMHSLTRCLLKMTRDIRAGQYRN